MGPWLDAGAADSAVAAGVLVEILLVVALHFRQ
jgi:hypothetical protein